MMPPGGLNSQDIPMFVLLSHDDAISQLANAVVRSVTDGYKNPNGCNVVATWFTTSTGSDCSLVKNLWDENHEIALHTVTHPSLMPGYPNKFEEIVGARDDLEKCGIPRSEMTGFRSPFLVHNSEIRTILHQNNFLYDSSIIEHPTSLSHTSKSFGERLFPYSMDNGIVQDCAWTAPSGQCAEGENYKGLWEIPLYTILKAELDAPNNGYSMDYGPGYGGDVFTTLKTNFDIAYQGNRAPFPFYIHSPWLTKENIASSRKFVEYALSKGDVYFVTMQEYITWMKNPIPATEYKNIANCKKVEIPPKILGQKCQVHELSEGEILADIAGRYGIINVRDLMKVNPSVGAMSVKPGTRLRIPPWDESCPTDLYSDIEMEQKDVSPEQNVNSPNLMNYPAEDIVPTCEILTVKEGDFLALIADKTGASVHDIAQENSIESTSILSVGQVLKIPPYPECCSAGLCAAQSASRIDILFPVIDGPVLDNSIKDEILDTLADKLQVPRKYISIKASFISRRRKLSQVSYQMIITVASNDPEGTYQSLRELLDASIIQNVISSFGYTLLSAVEYKIYNQGEAISIDENPANVALPEEGAKDSPGSEAVLPGTNVLEDNSTLQFPQTDPKGPENDDAASVQDTSTFWTTAVIVGVSVGLGVAIMTLGLMISIVIQKRSRNNKESALIEGSLPSANVTLRSQHSKSGKVLLNSNGLYQVEIDS